MFSPALLKIAGLVVAILAVFYTGVRWERTGWLEKQVAAQNHIAELGNQNAAIAAQYEKAKTSQKVTQKTIELEIANEIIKNPNSYNCVIPDGMRQLLNRAVLSSNGSK